MRSRSRIVKNIRRKSPNSIKNLHISVQESIYQVLKLALDDADRHDHIRFDGRFIECLFGKENEHFWFETNSRRDKRRANCVRLLPDFKNYGAFVKHLVYIYDIMGREFFSRMNLVLFTVDCLHESRNERSIRRYMKQIQFAIDIAREDLERLDKSDEHYDILREFFLFFQDRALAVKRIFMERTIAGYDGSNVILPPEY